MSINLINPIGLIGIMVHGMGHGGHEGVCPTLFYPKKIYGFMDWV